MSNVPKKGDRIRLTSSVWSTMQLPATTSYPVNSEHTIEWVGAGHAYLRFYIADGMYFYDDEFEVING